MGYQRKQERLTLTFTGQLEGLHATVRLASPETMRSVVNAARGAKNAEPADQADVILGLCEAFGKLLMAWDYEDEQGEPVPATAEALAAEDLPFVLALVYGWMDAMAVRAQQLTEAASVDEAELPMEVGG